MKKIFAAKIVMIVFANLINAQQVNTEWVINNFTGFPVGVMIGLDNNENVFVAGQSGDHTKIIITKYDTNGNLIWERFYSIQDLGVVATWLSVDPSGNIIVTGYPRTFSSNPVETGLLTLKYDNNGNLLWDKLISGIWAFTVRSIVDQSGNIYVTGRAWQYTATYDFVTVKYAPDGTQLWFDTFDQTGGFHTPTSMELDQSNNLFITGGGMSGGLITVMYNSDGIRQWIREKSGTAGHSIRVDGNGGIFITGSFYDVNTGTSNDITLLKYDYSGNLVWQKFYDFGNSEFGRLVNIDSQSNILITGFGDLPGEFPGWLTAKFDPSGNLLWYNRFKLNHTWEEFPYFTLVGPNDEIYVTGNVGVADGGTTYHGLETVRYNSDGSNSWVAEVNQYAGIGKGLALGDDMSLFAVGMFYYSVIKYSQSTPTGVEQISEIPETFVLKQNYPNPFNPSTKIIYTIPVVGTSLMKFVQLKVFDVLGNEVATLVDEYKPAGRYEVEFNSHSGEGMNLTSGVYFYQLRSRGTETSSRDGQAGQGIVETKKMILMK